MKNYRPTWQLHNAEPVAGNYYPVNSRLVVSGGPDFQAALMNDRSQVNAIYISVNVKVNSR